MISLIHNSLEDFDPGLNIVPYQDLVTNGELEELKIRLAQNPGVVPVQDAFGFTMLHWAVFCSKHEIAAAIVDAGADTNARSKNGYTVLMWSKLSPDILQASIITGPMKTVHTARLFAL